MSPQPTTHTTTSLIATINPATGQVVGSFEPHSTAEIERRLQLAAETFQEYRRTAFADRAARMIGAAEILEQEKGALARTMTLEMGKPIRAAIQEAEKCALVCRYYALNAQGFMADEQVVAGGVRNFLRYQPLGSVLAVMPWNFPFWQVFRFAAPALMAGNVALLKHASNVPKCALAIEAIFQRAGFPRGAFQTLLIGSSGVDRVIEDPRVKAVTLTGSVAAGSHVAATAGKQIKKTVLELGGSDPFIVMPSADLEKAVATAVQARTLNNGQSCIAAKRFIVDQRIADEFERRIIERMASLKIGDPLDENTDIGPLATKDALISLMDQVQSTVNQGATLLLGGRRLDRPGFFFEPTVLANIPPGSAAHREELFGPVASIFRTAGLEDALQVANDTQFGLGSCIWTHDERERDFFVNEIEAGLAFVNGMVASDPRLPFGGVKRSGYGRELSHHGLREFVNIKTVVLNEAGLSRTVTE